MLSIAVSAQQLEVDLAAARVACPDCRGPLARWGVRALARGADARRGAVAHAAAALLSWVWSYACAVSVVVGAVPARRGGGDRRGAAPGRWRRGASPDRPPAGTIAGNRARVAAGRAGGRRERASGRDAVAGRRGPGARSVTPAGSELADAVEAVMLGVRAWVLRFGHGQLSPRDRAMWLTAAMLCGPEPERLPGPQRPRSRPLRASGSHRSPPPPLAYRARSREPQPRAPWRAITSESEAVTDARRTSERSRLGRLRRVPSTPSPVHVRRSRRCAVMSATL